MAKIDITEDQDGNPKNVIKAAINPEHVEYDSVMGVKTANLPGWA